MGAEVLFLLAPLLMLASVEMRRSRKEAERLRTNIASLISGKVLNGAGSYSEPAHSHIWEYAKALNNVRNRECAERETYRDAISLQGKLTEVSANIEETAVRICDVLSDKFGDVIAGVCVMHVSSQTCKLEILKLSGLPLPRFKDYLADYVTARVSVSHQASWEYISESDEYFVPSNFGIKLALTVPLEDQGNTTGAIWVGFRSALVAGEERKRLLELVGQHSAACFKTAVRLTSETSKANQERDFILGLSHDLRSPGEQALFAIRALKNSRATLSDTERAFVNNAEYSVARQLDLLGDLFKFVQHNNNALKAETTTFSVAELCSEAIKGYEVLAGSKGVEFSVAPYPRIWLEADANHARRILENLLSNAVKYTDAGSISVGFERTADGLEISVSDTGIGVPDDIDPQLLFEQFRRSPNAGEKKGIGLGLSLTKSLAELNGASVSYRKNLSASSGSVFSVTLPVDPNAPQQEKNDENSVNRVLVVDDDEAYCRTVSRFIDDSVHEIKSENTLAGAIKRLEGEDFDALLTDLHIGATVARPLISAAKHLPVIVISGSTPQDLLRHGIDHPRLIFIEKPVSRIMLNQALSKIFKKKFTEEAASQ